jgi:subtilisin family serine protease
MVCASDVDAAQKKIVKPSRAIEGSYIVVLDEQHRGRAEAVGRELAVRHGGAVRMAWNDALVGFAASMTEKQAEALLHDPRVAFVEQDSPVRVSATQTGLDNTMYFLDRIDQRTRPVYNYGYSGSFNYCQNGAGVPVYVIDTGVASNHTELRSNVWPNNSRVVAGAGLNNTTEPCGWPAYDGGTSVETWSCDAAYALNDSHGTAVASVIAGRTFGVAKEATIVSVKAFDCDGTGTVSNILQAINWVTTNHVSGPAVANMSFETQGAWTTSDVSSLEVAVNGMINDGIVAVAAAGNFGGSACYVRPAGIPGVITVGASTFYDERWISSNGINASAAGSCVDLFAPGGVRAAHAYNCGDERPAWASNYAERPAASDGTSFAAALVSGTVAQYLQVYPAATPAQVATWITSNATANALSTSSVSLDGAPNRLLYSNCIN